VGPRVVVPAGTERVRPNAGSEYVTQGLDRSSDSDLRVYLYAERPNDSRLSGGPAAYLPGATIFKLGTRRHLSVRQPCPAAAGAGGAAPLWTPAQGQLPGQPLVHVLAAVVGDRPGPRAAQ